MAHSIIGFHYSTGGNKGGTGEWIASANQRGIPVGLKGVSDYGLIYEATEKGDQYGVDNWLVYRLSAAAGSVSRETPNYTIDPSVDSLMLANEAIDKLPPEFDNTKVWVELINEPRGKATNEPVWNNLHPVNYLGWWCYYAAVYLNSLGFKFCGPSFNSGEPGDDGKGLGNAVTQYSQPGMLKYLAYCAASPNMAALAVHDYIWELPAPQYPQLWGRWEAAIAAADLAGIPRTFSIFVTEFGYSPSNAPSYPAVALDLDRYNQIAARFPQVKFAAAWTLQSGYGDISNDVITWTNYPIDKQFDPGQQPAVTHSAFGGTLPGGTPPMPDNLLYNPSFELEHHHQNGDPNQQLADGWQGTFKTTAPYVQPEFNNKGKPYVPEHEWPLFFKDGDKTTKIFKGGLPCNFQFKTDPAAQPNLINLPPGRYRYSFWIYPDIVDRYENNQKVFSDNPDACKIRLFWNGVRGNWQSLHPYGGSAMRQIVYEWEHTGGDVVVGFQTDCPIKPSSATKGVNGIFTDAHDLRPVEAPPPPPPPTSTFEERLWKASIQEQRTNGVVFNPALGLWKQILADGLHVVTHERPFEGVNYQVGEKPDKSERWVYTWTAADGIRRFKWPEDTPPPPPPPPTGPTINDVVDQLATHPTLTYTTRPLSAITTLTIHHSVSGGGPNPLAEVKSIAQYHVNEPPNGRGWPGIGYHFCIGANGAIYQVNRLTTKSFHAGSYNAPGDENYWSAGICLLGNFTDNQPPQAQLDAARSLVVYLKSQLDTVTAVTRHKDMPGASTQCPGNTSPGWIGYVAGQDQVSMPPYFLPANGDYGDIIILKNNWGDGDERQQLQRVVNVSYVTKNQQWEKRVIASDGIYLKMDTSPGNGQYYTISGSPWLPLSWGVGDEWLRFETVSFYRKSDCRPAAAPYTVTNKIRFAALHSSWTSAAGVTLNNVIELQWLIGGNVEETYHFAPGKGLVSWANRAGKKSWVTEIIPVGQQGNNQRETGCFST